MTLAEIHSRIPCAEYVGGRQYETGRGSDDLRSAIRTGGATSRIWVVSRSFGRAEYDAQESFGASVISSPCNEKCNFVEETLDGTVIGGVVNHSFSA